MDPRMILHCILFMSIPTLIGCSKSAPTAPISPSATDNLLRNPSFESNGSPSLEGWIVDVDTNRFSFSSDVPTSGGRYSVALETMWGWATICQNVAANPGNHQYRFSAWAKGEYYYGGQIRGRLKLCLKRADSLLFMKYVTVTDTIWNEYSIVDTLSVETGDSLRVVITGGYSQLARGTTFYDLCQLKQLD